MRNKRGMLWSLWMVIMTLLLCGVSISLYNVQQDKLAVSLVSPLPVLELRDNLTVFEMEEKELIKTSLESVSFDFGSDEFISEFRENFILGLNTDMKDFLLKDMVWGKNKIDVSSEDKQDVFFRNIVYPKVGMDIGKLRFVRGELGKSEILKSGDWQIVNFQVDFDYNFKKEYLISKAGNSYIVEEVE